MAVLVTGCGGYIGAIACKILLEKGFEVVGIDNLSKSKKSNIPSSVNFYQGDIGNQDLVKQVCRENSIDAVLHFAAFIEVAQSVANPKLYEENNYWQSVYFINALQECSVNNLIFSSSAAVYGNPQECLQGINEDANLNPINPYGKYKLEIENYLQSITAKNPNFRYLAFRYFNVVGASEELGECHEPESHIIPLALDALLGKRKVFKIFGTDYPTPDGTAIRDYVHVVDLAEAHINAIEFLQKNSTGLNQAYNLGYSHGFSVKEIISSIEKIAGQKIPVELCDRRPGDPAILLADNRKALNAGFFKPTKQNIDIIIKDALEHRKLYHSKSVIK